MARIRTIKPELWQDEQIGTLPSDTMVLFIGLISHADDEGRLRGNTLLVRSQVFPYRPEVDVEAGLRQLARARRIVRYTVDGQSYIWIRKFEEHQRIDKPKPSALPAPPDHEDESETNPRLVLDESATSPSRKGMEGNGEEGNGKEGDSADESKAAPVHPLVLAWRELCPDLPQWKGEPNKGRRKALDKALERRPLEEWRDVFARIARLPFCRGQNDRQWRADLDWGIRPDGAKPETATLVLEGKYGREDVSPPDPLHESACTRWHSDTGECGKPATRVIPGGATYCDQCADALREGVAA